MYVRACVRGQAAETAVAAADLTQSLSGTQRDGKETRTRRRRREGKGAVPLR